MITVATKPQTYSPLNAAIFKVTSDLPGILQFQVTVYDALTDLVMTVQKYATLPMVENGTLFDLAPLLSSFVDYQIDNSTTLLVNIDKPLKKYNVEVTELYRDGTGAIVPGASLLLPDAFYIWNGEISTVEFQNFDYGAYAAKPGGLCMFLNNKPATSKTYYNNTNYLYFMSTINAKVEIKFYRRPNNLLSTHYVTGVVANNAYRFDATLADLIAFYGVDALFNETDSEFDEEFTPPFGSPTDYTNGYYYTIRLVDLSNVGLSETRTFYYGSQPCGSYVDLLFSNDLGGYDSILFTNPKQSITVNRATINANTLQIDESGNLTAESNGVFNPDNVTISTAKNSTFSIVSETLTDDEGYFAKGIVESENVLVRLANGYLYPVQVQESSYDISKRKYSTNNTRLTLTLKITDTNIKL